MIGGKLTDIRTLQFLLGKAGLTPRRESGQNFLISDEVVEATLAALNTSTLHVTELGAGVGTLTQALVGSGFQVRAIERDTSLAKILHEQLPKKLRERVEIITDDLRNVDWAPTSAEATAGRQGKAYQLVGNIPYNLSGLIIRKITQLLPAPETVILLVQKEVADRLLAASPDMNLLGLAAQLWGKGERLLSVPRSCFWPEPKVDSSLVLLVPHGEEGLSEEERENILRVAKLAFQTKRKQLGGVLTRAWGEDEAKARLAFAGVPGTARPQELSLAQWQRLAEGRP